MKKNHKINWKSKNTRAITSFLIFFYELRRKKDSLRSLRLKILKFFTFFDERKVTGQQLPKVLDCLVCFVWFLVDFVHSCDDFENFWVLQCGRVSSNDAGNERARTSPIGNNEHFAVSLLFNQPNLRPKTAQITNSLLILNKTYDIDSMSFWIWTLRSWSKEMTSEELVALNTLVRVEFHLVSWFMLGNLLRKMWIWLEKSDIIQPLKMSRKGTGTNKLHKMRRVL